MTPEIPLPASKDGLAEITIISIFTVSTSLIKTEQLRDLRIELFTFVSSNVTVLLLVIKVRYVTYSRYVT